MSSFTPTGSNRWHNFGNTPTSSASLQTEFWPVDTAFMQTMGLHLVLGRNFSGELSTDSSAIIVNETAAQKLGYGSDPLDKKVSYSYKGGSRKFHIIGVVKDFNFNSLRNNITPWAMVMIPDRDPQWMDNLSI